MVMIVGYDSVCICVHMVMLVYAYVCMDSYDNPFKRFLHLKIFSSTQEETSILPV